LAAARHARAHGNFARAHRLLDSISLSDASVFAASLSTERRVETALVLAAEGRGHDAVRAMAGVAAACPPEECVFLILRLFGLLI
jgi:hypothetical protein